MMDFDRIQAAVARYKADGVPVVMFGAMLRDRPTALVDTGGEAALAAAVAGRVTASRCERHMGTAHLHIVVDDSYVYRVIVRHGDTSAIDALRPIAPTAIAEAVAWFAGGDL